MTITKTQAPPSLPFGTPDYQRSYQDQLNNVLRIYFNSVNSVLDQIVTLLNEGGYFPQIDAGTVNAGTVNADTGNVSTLLSNYITAKSLYSQAIQAGSVQASTIVGGNITGSRVNSSLFTGLGAEITLPHIGAYDSGNQYADGDNDPTIVTWDATDSTFGFSLASNVATSTYDGVFKIDYSLQFINTDNAAHDIYVWLQVNGSNVSNSATKFTIPARKAVGDYSYICAYSTVTFTVSANDSIGLWWATDKAYNTTGPVDGVYMFSEASASSPYSRPAVPSAIGNILYMSAPTPPLTKVVPVGVGAKGKVGAVTIVTTR